MNKYIGEYSQQAVPYCGTVIWRDTKGKEFEVTSVHLPTDKGSSWKDKIIVSEDLVTFVRRTRSGDL